MWLWASSRTFGTGIFEQKEAATAPSIMTVDASNRHGNLCSVDSMLAISKRRYISLVEDALVEEFKKKGMDAKACSWSGSPKHVRDLNESKKPYISGNFHLWVLNLQYHHDFSNDDTSCVGSAIDSYFSSHS